MNTGIKIALFMSVAWIMQGCTATLNATSHVPDNPLVKQSHFAATTVSKDTLYLCGDDDSGIAYLIKDMWETGVYDDTPRPHIVILNCEDYSNTVESRIRYTSRDFAAARN